MAKKLARPLSPKSMLLHRFAWNAVQKKQPLRFGCRHALGNNIDQGGAGGSGVMWPHAGGLRFFSRTREKILLGLWMCKHKLEQIPFAFAKTSIQNNPNTLSSSKLLPTKQRSNIVASAPHVGNNWRSEAVCLDVSCMVHYCRLCPHASRSRIAVFCWWKFKGAQTSCFAMFCTVHVQRTPQRMATKHCKYNLFSQKVMRKHQ